MLDNSCHDCGAKPGQLHDLGCDTERCPLCGGQMLQCYSVIRCPSCRDAFVVSVCVTDDGGYPTPITNEMRLPWTGEWPGLGECREFGWYSYFDSGWSDPVTGSAWHRCGPEHEGAGPDLNRLHGPEAEWSRDLKRFVLRG